MSAALLDEGGRHPAIVRRANERDRDITLACGERHNQVGDEATDRTPGVRWAGCSGGETLNADRCHKRIRSCYFEPPLASRDGLGAGSRVTGERSAVEGQ